MWVYICICCVHAYQYTQTFVLMCVEARTQYSPSSLTNFHFLFWDMVSLNLEPTDWLDGWPASCRDPPLCLPSTVVKKMQNNHAQSPESICLIYLQASHFSLSLCLLFTPTLQLPFPTSVLWCFFFLSLAGLPRSQMRYDQFAGQLILQTEDWFSLIPSNLLSISESLSLTKNTS